MKTNKIGFFLLFSACFFSGLSWSKVSIIDGNIVGEKYKTDSGESIKKISETSLGALGEAAKTGNTKALKSLKRIDKKILQCDNLVNQTKCRSLNRESHSFDDIEAPLTVKPM